MMMTNMIMRKIKNDCYVIRMGRGPYVNKLCIVHMMIRWAVPEDTGVVKVGLW